MKRFRISSSTFYMGEYLCLVFLAISVDIFPKGGVTTGDTLMKKPMFMVLYLTLIEKI